VQLLHFGMVKNEARKLQVRELNKLARKCNVERVHEDAGRAKVTALVNALRASSCSGDDKAEAERIFRKYKGAFDNSAQEGDAGCANETPQDGAAAAADVDAEPQQQRLRGTSFLLSYNWDFFGKPFPDGTPPAQDHDDLWRTWLSWKTGKKKELGVSTSTHKMEESLESDLSGRMHFHWKVNLENALDKPTHRIFYFHGVRPDVRKTFGTPAARKKGARAISFEEAFNRSHFYCWADKKGPLAQDGNPSKTTE